MCGHIWKVSDTFLRCVHGALLGSANQLHLGVQYVHEDGIHNGLIRHCLPDVCQVQSDVWPQPRHIQDWVLVDTHIGYGAVDKPWIHSYGGTMDILNLFGICGYLTAIVPGVKNWRGWKYYIPLSVCSWILQSSVSLELGIPLRCRRPLWADCYYIRCCTNCTILWFLLSLHNKSIERKEVAVACLSDNWQEDCFKSIWQLRLWIYLCEPINYLRSSCTNITGIVLLWKCWLTNGNYVWLCIFINLYSHKQ